MEQKNWLLILGVTLPGVVLLGFFVFTYFARQTVAPPAHDLVYAAYADVEPLGVNVQYRVLDQRLVVQASPSPQPMNWGYLLYRWDHETFESSPIEVALPESVTEHNVAVDVPALLNLVVSDDTEAPDGYEFHTDYDRGPGIIGELFYRSRRGGFTVERLGVVHHVKPPPPARSYASVQFLGWILEDG